MNKFNKFNKKVSCNFSVVTNMLKTLSCLLYIIMLALIFVFSSTNIYAQNWNETESFFGEAENDFFGHDVAISGNYAVVGAYGWGGSPLEWFYGKAFVYEKISNEWTKVAELQSTEMWATGAFASRVDIEGDIIAIGTGLGPKTVCVYEKPQDGWTDMTETAKLTTTTGIDENGLGTSVSINGDIIVAGAHLDDENGNKSGAVYIFQKSGDNWTDMTETAKLTASDAQPEDRLGYWCISTFNDIIVAGANFKNGHRGATYLFEKPDGGWTNMTETAKLSPSDPEIDGDFGWSHSIYDNTVVVSAVNYDNENGKVYIFEKPQDGWANMTETASLSAFEPLTAGFGFSVAIQNNIIFVGTSTHNVQVFNKNGEDWSNPDTELITPNDIHENGFGYSIDVSGAELIIGAPFDASIANNAGAAYFFYVADLPQLEWSSTTFLEDDANNGSISTTIELVLLNETFVVESGSLEYFETNNVPDGLTVECNATSNITATITLTGNATNHDEDDNVDNMEITFLDDAFNGGNASEIIGYSKTDLEIIFQNEVSIISYVDNSFTIYPNPSNGTFTINSEQFTNNNKQLTITDITGKIIKQFTINNEQFTIDISEQSAGIYFINIQTETGIYTEKLIIN